jgi:hypothetical protein
MSQPKTVDRGVSFIKFVLGLLRAHPDGMCPRDIYAEIESKLPLDDFDKETMKGSGYPGGEPPCISTLSQRRKLYCSSSRTDGGG